MGTLYVAIDLFYPGRYRPRTSSIGAETYEQEENFAYVVLQPAITKDAATDPISLAQYFQAAAADLGSTHRLSYLDKHADPRIGASAVPVPFPPLTQLSLALKWNSVLDPVDIRRELPTTRINGQVIDSPLLLKTEYWPEFSTANFAQPPIRDWQYLSPIARAEILSWGVALIPQILRRAHAHDRTAAEGDAYDLLRALETQMQNPNAPVSEQQVRSYLQAAQGGVARITTLWLRMIQPDAGSGAHAIMAPRYLHDKASLSTDPVRLLGLSEGPQVPIAVSYHNKLWRDFRSRTAGGEPDPVQSAEQALSRLFGFGERLRWPKPSPDDGFMIADLAPNRITGFEAIGTNAHSVLGQVFRIPLNIGSGARPKTMIISVQGMPSLDLSSAFSLLLHRIESDPHATVDLTLGRDADRPSGFFIYLPKMAEAPAAAGADPASLYYLVPPTLLDAVDRNARWSSPPSADGLIVRNAPRTGLRASELFRPELLGPVQRRLSHKVHVRLFDVTGSPSPVFKLSLTDQLHPDEAAELNQRFAGLNNSSAELWITMSTDAGGGVRAWRLDGHVMDVVADKTELFAIIADIADPPHSLRDLLSKAAHPAGGSSSSDAASGHLVDLMFGTTAIANPLFNLLLQPALPSARAPLCILNGSFTSRLSASTDRLMDRLELTLSPSPFPQMPDQPLLDHLANFNKLRVALSSGDHEVVQRTEHPSGDPREADGRVVTFLTYPDAAIPMGANGYTREMPPWSGAAPPVGPARHYGYFVSHVFTQDSRADGATSDQERNAAEALRYVNYLTPHIPWRVEGNAEHQYTFRVPFTGPDIKLPLSTDISHPGNYAKLKSGDETPAALLRWALVDGPVIKLTFARKFVGLALATDGSTTARPARLRTIYEPLAELVAAVDRGTATLELERWVFDGDLHRSADGDQSTAIVANLRLAGSHSYKMKATSPELQGLEQVRALLRMPLTALEKELGRIATGTGDDWLVINIPFDGRWTAAGDPLNDPLPQSAEALRVGLRLSRAADSVSSPSTLPADPKLAPGYGAMADPDRITSYPELGGETFSALKAAAASELLDYLSTDHPSPLRTSFAWLRAVPAPKLPVPAAVNPSDPEGVYDPNRPRRLFGELTQFLVIPAGQRPKVARVADLYYVPLAFRPLREHPQFGDPATTLEFAEFLIGMLDDLCNGRPTDIVDESTSSQETAYTVAKALRSQLLPAVVSQLTDLIAYVHNDDDAGAMADPLFAYVNKMVNRVLPDASGALAACSKLLTATPGLFVTSKGIGLAIFEPEAWTDRTYAIQIEKRIHASTDPLLVPAHAPGTDSDQFLFDRIVVRADDRFLLDILDDARYDNEFEIPESIFNPPRDPFQNKKPAPLLRDRHRLTARGATQARSGEDVIEQRNRFDEVSTQERQIEADTVHWNPSWRTKPDNTGAQKRFYLLPSRRYPAIPAVLKPKNAGTDSDQPAWRCPIDLVFSTPTEKPDLPTKITARLNQLLQEQAEIRFSGSGGEDLIASGLTGGPRFALAAPANTKGWWHVESYGTAHYFLIEPDEELDQDDDILANDRFSIEVELHEQPPGDDPLAADSLSLPNDNVTRWFQYARQLQTDIGATQPAKASLPVLEQELRRWLDPASELLKAYVPPLTDGTSGAMTRTITRFDHINKRLVELQGTAEPFSIGSVLAAEVLQLRKSNGEVLPRYALRVVVLDEPWRYTRVRVRTERNFRNLNNDMTPDINKAFQMVGKFSGWSGHGREPAHVDFSSMANRNLPSKISQLQPVDITAAQYLSLRQDQDASYGDLLGQALAATFVDVGNQTQSFWNVKAAQSEHLRVGGMMLQFRPDLHPRYGLADVKVQEPTRTEHIARQHLPSVPANGAGPLFSRVARRHVTGLHQLSRIVWSNARMEPVLTCTWPVKFRS
jgi:hypothetical protein